MQSENNKTTTQDDNNITTTQGESEQCKTKTNTTYKSSPKKKNPNEEVRKPLGFIQC
jgi:hypothetical protein